MNRRATSVLMREPLVHFFVAGGLLFALNAWHAGGRVGQADATTIPLTAEQLQWVTQTWERQWGTAPGEQERRDLVAELLKEKLLAREAREFGLDVDDMVIERRLAQKMSFVVEDAGAAVEPTEDELKAFYAAHTDSFRSDGRVSFEQVYFNPARRGARLAGDIDTALARLRAAGQGAGADELGDRLLVDAEGADVDERTVASVYGPDFASALVALEPGRWQGPVRSGFGLHLVRLSARTPGAARPFDEVRAAVVTAWREDRQQRAMREHLGQLAQRYGIVADASVRPLLPEWKP